MNTQEKLPASKRSHKPPRLIVGYFSTKQPGVDVPYLRIFGRWMQNAGFVLALGAPMPAITGARSWAGGKPNLLNVAVSRAQRRLYVIGSRSGWKSAGVFSTLHCRLPSDRDRAGVE
jgi:hypothetical protein